MGGGKKRRPRTWHHIAHDSRAAEWRLAERLRETSDEGPYTVVWARLGRASINAAVRAADVGQVLAEVDDLAQETGLGVADCRQFIIDMLKEGKHHGDHKRTIAQSILWSLCRGQAGPTAEPLARAGGARMGYNITPLDRGFNFRTFIETPDQVEASDTMPWKEGSL